MKLKCSLCGTIHSNTAFKSGAVCENCLTLIKQEDFGKFAEPTNTIR